MSFISAPANVFLGLPFNIASYALLVHMMAQQCDLEVGDFVWTGGDSYLYSNHMDQTHLQLSREPRPLPKLIIKRKPESSSTTVSKTLRLKDTIHIRHQSAGRLSNYETSCQSRRQCASVFFTLR